MQSFWILVATFSTALTYAAMKLAGADCCFYEIFFVRATYLVAATGLLACVGRVSLATAHPWLHLRRVAAGITALSLNILAVRHLPLGVAQTLAYTAPLFIAAWAAGMALWHSGRMDWRLTAAVVVGFAGVCLVMRPTSFQGHFLWAALGLFSGFCSAVVSLTLKELGREGEPVVRTVTYFALGGFLISGVLTAVLGEQPVGELFADPWLMVVGVTTVLAQFAQALGWGKGRTLLCATLQFSAVFFAVALGAAFFGELPDAAACVGIAVIVAAECAAAYLQLKGVRKVAQR